MVVRRAWRAKVKVVSVERDEHNLGHGRHRR